MNFVIMKIVILMWRNIPELLDCTADGNVGPIVILAVLGISAIGIAVKSSV